MKQPVAVLFLCFCFIIDVINADADVLHEQTKDTELVEEGRILWAQVGQLIEATPFFPITINVPDMIYGFAEMMGNVYQYFFGGSSEQGGQEAGAGGGGSTPRAYLVVLRQLAEFLVKFSESHQG